MATISFSHHYHKMPEDVSNTRLMQVFVEERKNFSRIFLKYDTTTKENKPFPISKCSKFIILFLGTNINGKFFLWTTIRPWTKEKEDFYRSIQGDVVEIKIKGELI